jgi:hypothetical protein
LSTSAYHESRSSYPKTSYVTAMAAKSTLPPQLPIVSGDEEPKRNAHPDQIGINTACMILAINVFLLLAHARSHLPSTPSLEPSTTLENDREADFDGGDDNEDSALVPFNREPSSHAQSDFGCLEDDSAPDGFAARFEALQDALPSLQALQNLTEWFSRDLFRLVILGMGIALCFTLHAIAFIVTGRFGGRGMQLVKELEDAKHTVRHLLYWTIWNAHLFVPLGCGRCGRGLQ